MSGRRAARICLDGWEGGVTVKARVLMWGVERRRELSVETEDKLAKIFVEFRLVGRLKLGSTYCTFRFPDCALLWR